MKKLFEKKNIWELTSIIQYLKKLINLFYKNYLNKLLAIFFAINTPILMIRLTVKLIKLAKQKQRQSINNFNKQTKKN